MHHAHGQCLPATQLKGMNVSAVYTIGIGLRALQRLNDIGINVYKLQGKTVQDVIEEFNAGQAIEFRADLTCGGHHGCH
jgi:predicted Fe-Mo cluster-binding NifX family protein